MLGRILILILLFVKVSASEADEGTDFIFNGFVSRENLTTDGAANITGNGLLRLTPAEYSQIGHAFYPKPLSFNNSTNTSTGNNTFSFSTTFVFAIVSNSGDDSGTGFAFLMSPSKHLIQSVRSGAYLGLFSPSNNGDPSNRIAAIEFDTVFNKEIGDIDDNHVGIDINSLNSSNASPAGYYGDDEDGGLIIRNVSLASGRRFQAWVEYDGVQKQLNVTVAPLQVPKPKRPLLSSKIDLSSVIEEYPVYVGFSASTATHRLSSHYVLGWSFKVNGEARPLDASILPKVAAGLFYLHEKWAQAILHRDIKPANVLLDENFNGKLGDFGLSRLYDHGSDPNTTRLAGTVGYMAPELSRTGKATKASDVYAFGVLMLEVACGRRPTKYRAPANQVVLVDWVLGCLKEGTLFTVVDSRLGTEFRKAEVEEVEMVLKLGLLCSHDSAGDRPSIGEVIQFLNGDLPLPEIPADSLRSGTTPVSWTPSDGSANLLTSSASIGSVSILTSGR
ncbi:hypothetical protein H6P81_007500 [Aristolochia fimbriata]|uniref:non-specific serine/threonine protein kinase n=1 Tax=Aristolochia fimbriata TaxID=158543 RepID=A0AAV7F1Q0_ARIFI|nr:hypothetical protein H6P81_007500 [Aristolochia fimbriata]